MYREEVMIARELLNIAKELTMWDIEFKKATKPFGNLSAVQKGKKLHIQDSNGKSVLTVGQHTSINDIVKKLKSKTKTAGISPRELQQWDQKGRGLSFILQNTNWAFKAAIKHALAEYEGNVKMAKIQKSYYRMHVKDVRGAISEYVKSQDFSVKNLKEVIETAFYHVSGNLDSVTKSKLRDVGGLRNINYSTNDVLSDIGAKRYM